MMTAVHETSTSYKAFWDEQRETMPPGSRRHLVLERVQAQLHAAYARLPFYRRLYDAHGVKPDDVRSLEDFTRRIPVVTKDMLRADQAEHPPFGSYLGCNPRDILRVFSSSGTTGTPTLYGIAREDWERAAEAQAMAVWGMGVRPHDVVHFLFPFGMFVGGWAILLGTTRVGASNFPAGAMESRKHIQLMQQASSTVLAGTPSYCLHLGEVAEEMGVDLSTLAVHTLVVGGEPGGTLEGTRALLRETFGDVRVIDTGNTSECFPTQMNSTCHAEQGVHVYEDEVYLEIVDTDDPARIVPDGQPGATVYTTLWRRSQPMIRFWAGDQATMVRESCPCGRTYPRLPGGLRGRLDDMLLVKGANVYPSTIEDALRQVQGVGAEYRVIIDKYGALDDIRIESEYDPRWLDTRADRSAARAELTHRIESALRYATGLRCPVRLVEPGTQETQLFKARRVDDRRPATSELEGRA